MIEQTIGFLVSWVVLGFVLGMGVGSAAKLGGPEDEK